MHFLQYVILVDFVYGEMKYDKRADFKGNPIYLLTEGEELSLFWMSK